MKTADIKKEIDENILGYAEYRNNGTYFTSSSGMVITKARKGYVRVDLDIEKRHLNTIGSVDGGCIFALADSACGSTIYTVTGQLSTTVDANIHYLRPCLNKAHIYAESQVIKIGKKIAVIQISIKDDDGQEMAVGIFTNMLLDDSKVNKSFEKK